MKKMAEREDYCDDLLNQIITEWMKKNTPVTIIPGNRNSSHLTEKFIFQQLLPLSFNGQE